MKTTIAICGSGIAGVATAYYVLQQARDIQVLLIDKNLPLSLTTSKSGENFRDYWPQECMHQFMSHSILLMKELREKYGHHSFCMEHSGYNFISHRTNNPIFETNARKNPDDYIEEITAIPVIQRNFPYLDRNIKKVVRIKNAGKIDVYAMGSLLLREAKKQGLIQIAGEILAIENRDSRFRIVLDSKRTVHADKIVIATGPFINTIATMFGFQFPVLNTLQRKFIIPDPLKIIPGNMPFTIYADPQYLDWSEQETDFFGADEQYKWLLNEFPGGLHIKPDSGGIKLGWAFHTENVQPEWETPKLDFFPQVVLKGASRFIPELAQYENNIPSPLIEYAGYYTRTKENWPLIGPTGIPNIYVIGALSGYGTMSACAAGNLCAVYILNKTELPAYAAYFHPLRYQDNTMRQAMAKLKIDGQL